MMRSCHDVTTVFAKHLTSVPDFLSNLFRSGSGQKLLGVNAPMKGDPAAEFLGKLFRIHILCGGLNRIQNA